MVLVNIPIFYIFKEAAMATKFVKAYADTKFEDICAWCKDNNEGEWLYTMITEKVEKPVYEDKAAKKAGTAKETVKALRTYLEVKKEFFTKFAPELLPTKKSGMLATYKKYFG